MKEVRVKLSHSLSDPEWKTLSIYCEKVRRLLATKFLSTESDGIKANITVRPDTGMTFSANLPPEEQISEFLMAFRFFYLQKEPTHFPSILKILGKHTSQQEAHLALKSFGNKWRNALFAESLIISIDGKKLSASTLLDLWFNAHYFHYDEEKQQQLDELKSNFTEPFAKYMLLDAALEATTAIFKVYDGMQQMVDVHQNPNKPFNPDRLRRPS